MFVRMFETVVSCTTFDQLVPATFVPGENDVSSFGDRRLVKPPPAPFVVIRQNTFSGRKDRASHGEVSMFAFCATAAKPAADKNNVRISFFISVKPFELG